MPTCRAQRAGLTLCDGDRQLEGAHYRCMAEFSIAAGDPSATVLVVPTRLAIGVNMAASAALVGAGAWHAAAARSRHPERGRR